MTSSESAYGSSPAWKETGLFRGMLGDACGDSFQHVIALREKERQITL